MTDDLITRLLHVDGKDGETRSYRNPDGPEAVAEIQRLKTFLSEEVAELCGLQNDPDLVALSEQATRLAGGEEL